MKVLSQGLLVGLVIFACWIPAQWVQAFGASDYRGWAITVLHGDMVRVLDGGNRITTVRLKSIDAPERDQPYGEEARKYLASLVSGKEVKIKTKKLDDWGNVIGQVWVAPPDCTSCDDEILDVNLALVKAGLAWWSRQHAKQQSASERSDYEEAELEARRNQLGLWSQPDPKPPWEWREEHGDLY